MPLLSVLSDWVGLDWFPWSQESFASVWSELSRILFKMKTIGLMAMVGCFQMHFLVMDSFEQSTVEQDV